MFLLLDNIIYSLQNMGGVSVYWYELTKRLAQTQLNLETHGYPGYEHHLLPIAKPDYLHQTAILKERLTAFSYSPNHKHLFHSSYYRYSSSPKAINIVTVHDLIVEKFHYPILKNLKTYAKKRAILRADKLICVSENTRNDLCEYYHIPEERTTVIYNGASDLFYPLQNPQPTEKKILLYIGARSFYKRFDFFAELCNLVGQSYQPVIVGGGNLSSKEKQLFKQHIPTFYPYLTTEALNVLFNQAFALIYPSRYEGFGIPLAEASKAGCPILCFNHSCIPEIVGEQYPAYLEGKTEAQQLESGLTQLTLLEQSHFRKTCVQSLQFLSNRFQWQHTAELTLKCYDSV